MKVMPTDHGPFLAEQIRSGDPYELSRGHAIRCMPTGDRGSKAEGAVFEARRLDVDEQLRAAVAECRDPERLRNWLVVAVTAPSAREVLDT